MRRSRWTGLVAVAGLTLGGVSLAQDAPEPAGGTPGANAVSDAPTGLPIWIGIDASPLASALAHQLRLEAGVGLVVDRVAYNSPAANAGIHEYDVIQKLNGRLIDDPRHFTALFRPHRPGDVVTFTLIREGQPIDVKVTLGEPPASPPATEMPVQPSPSAPPARHHSHGLRLPKINVHIDQRGDLVATDGAGHTLFRQPLDFTIDTPELPFSIHIEPKPGRPEPTPADPQER